MKTTFKFSVKVVRIVFFEFCEIDRKTTVLES